MLAPQVRPGQIVVLDNLSCHKDATDRRLIEERGCRVLFLPAYAPAFSPIEQALSKVKQHLRRLGARRREALQAALAQAIDLITPQDARAFFWYSGYRLTGQ